VCEHPGEQHILLAHKLLHRCQAIEGYLHHLLAEPDINLYSIGVAEKCYN
jgi:hypothetical protein